MLTQDRINKIAEEVFAHVEEVSGNDEIMNGLLNHVARQIEADLTQLWFYGEALQARKQRALAKLDR